MNSFGLVLLAHCNDHLFSAAPAEPSLVAQARAATASTITFEIVVLLAVAAACWVMNRRVPHFPLKFLAAAFGVMIFEVFTAPMWRNQKLGVWGYVYHDVSWILTVGWTGLILSTVTLVDTLAPRLARAFGSGSKSSAVPFHGPHRTLEPISDGQPAMAASLPTAQGGVTTSSPTAVTMAAATLAAQTSPSGLGAAAGLRALPRFLLYLAVLLPLVIVAENVVVWLGIRSYAPEVEAVLSGWTIGLVPVEALYYVPVFTALVIAFAKYWSFVIDDAALVPVRRTRWLRAVGLTVLSVVLFEVMIEPIVENCNLPRWSYFYRDLSFLLTAGWVLIIAAAGIVVQRFMMNWPIPQRFTAALVLITVFALPFESFLIHHGYRIYGESATANFTGYTTWLTGVPIEIVFAIPLYMALVITFIRYWEIVGDNRL